MERPGKGIALRILRGAFSVCKVADYSMIDQSRPWCFTGATDEELSLVCETERVPKNVTAREDGWRGLGVRGALDFSLIGILAGISAVLAGERIGIFVVSTFNTDYIFVKEEKFARAVAALEDAGYGFEED